MRQRGVWGVVALLVACVVPGGGAWTGGGLAFTRRHVQRCNAAWFPAFRTAYGRRAMRRRTGNAPACTALWFHTEILDPSTVDPNEPTPYADAIERMLPEDPVQAHDEVASASETIDAVISLLVEQRRRNMPFNETVLLESAPELTKNELYESIMSSRISRANLMDQELLRQVDAFTQGFVVTERAKRLDLKIQALIFSGLAGQLEPLMEKLRSMRELDRPLLVRIRQKLQQLQEVKKQALLEQQKNQTDATMNAFPAGTVEEETEPQPPNKATPVSLVDEVLRNRDVMSLLKTLEHRVEVELRLADRWEVHLLGSLLKSSHQEIVAKLTMSLKRIEQVQAFGEFLDDAIQRLRNEREVLGRQTPYAEPVKLAPETFERLKVVKAALDEFNRASQSPFAYDSSWYFGDSTPSGPKRASKLRDGVEPGVHED